MFSLHCLCCLPKVLFSNWYSCTVLLSNIGLVLQKETWHVHSVVIVPMKPSMCSASGSCLHFLYAFPISFHNLQDFFTYLSLVSLPGFSRNLGTNCNLYDTE